MSEGFPWLAVQHSAIGGQAGARAQALWRCQLWRILGAVLMLKLQGAPRMLLGACVGGCVRLSLEGEEDGPSQFEHDEWCDIIRL